jgi:hypothetical protein
MYYDQLLAELGVHAPTDEVAGEARKNRSQGAAASWPDLYRLEAHMIQAEMPSRLRLHLDLLRRRYADLLGLSLTEYLRTAGRTGEQGDSALRTEAAFILSELYRHYIVERAYQKARNRFAMRLVVGTLCSMGVIGAAMTVTLIRGKGITLFPIALAVGAFGEFVSAYRGFQTLRPRGGQSEHLEYLADLRPNPFFGVPIIGILAATVTYLLFSGRLLSGQLFPEFDWQNTQPTQLSFAAFMQDFGPKDGVSYGKTLIWCFVAGFSERFFSNFVDRFAAKGFGGGETVEAGTRLASRPRAGGSVGAKDDEMSHDSGA